MEAGPARSLLFCVDCAPYRPVKNIDRAASGVSEYLTRARGVRATNKESAVSITTATATLNVVTGSIVIEPPLDDPQGGLINGATGAPWGEDEQELDRADAMLNDIGVSRDSEWVGDSEVYTATVRVAL
jgi:hypothetical protein